MSVRRVMGTETEYGISVPGQPAANPMVASSQVVNAYAVGHGARRAGPAGTSRRSRRCATRAASTCRARSPTRASSPTRTSAWPTSSSPTAPGSTSTTPTRSTPRPRSPPRATPCAGTRRGSRSCSTPPRRRRQLPGGAPIVLYKNNTDSKGASYGTHENYLMRRSTPFADIVRHLTPFFVSRQVVVRRRPGRHRPGRPRARLPDQPARRLLRGRGRARDHAEAPDHQHPRRAARRPREVPPAARHHRRRQPRRGLDVPQGRHHRAGAGDDRGPVPRPPTSRVDGPVAALRAVSHDPTLHAADHAARRPQADRASSCSGSTSTWPASTSRTGSAPTPTRRPPTCWPAGSRCSTGSSATRCCAPASSTGWPSSSCSSSTATATAWTGTTPSCS